MKNKHTMRSFAAAALSDPRFKPRVAQTNKGRKDPKLARRKWKETHEY